jgi:transcriptional regulator with XRE-family HTH domain
MSFLTTRLKEMRNKAGYTQEELAARLGMGIRQIYRYEAGENEPTADVVSRLAKELQCTSDYLLGLSDNPLPTMSIDDLSADETKLLIAYRRGQTKEALQILAIGPEMGNQPKVAPRKPAANG